MAFAAWLLVGCGASISAANRDATISSGGTASGKVTQTELQQEVQRVATSFMDRAGQAIDPSSNDAPRRASDETLLRMVLIYTSSALDIATGPFPEVNALDMAVFASLCRSSLEQHWIPRGLGPGGAELLTAFKVLERDVWTILSRIIDERKQADLRAMIADWQREHPQQFRVAGVRFQQFSAYAAKASARTKAFGLLRDVRSAIALGDQALLISERAFFAAHRLPFLLRLQARVGVQETVTDTLSRAEVEGLMAQVPALRPMLSELMELTDRAGTTAHEARMLMAAVDPTLAHVTAPENRELITGMAGTLDSANRLTESSLRLVREMRGSLPSDPEQTLGALEQRADSVLRRWIVYLLILGFAWSLFFWSGYVLVKRLTS